MNWNINIVMRKTLRLVTRDRKELHEISNKVDNSPAVQILKEIHAQGVDGKAQNL